MENLWLLGESETHAHSIGMIYTTKYSTCCISKFLKIHFFFSLEVITTLNENVVLSMFP